MKKTLLYILVLGLLCGGIYFLFFAKNNENPYGHDEAGFTVKDTASVGKIFIADFENETVLVERTDTGWLLNKKYMALPSMVRMIMNTLYQQQALYPVSQGAFKYVIKELSTVGTKVEVYSKSGRVINKFYVGGTAPNNSGTYMMMEGAKSPYIVHIQGFVGVLGSRFSGKIKDWRDRNIFNIPADKIKSITVQYYYKPENSFTISREQGGITVKGNVIDTYKAANLNMHNANLYLGYFGNVNCEGYLNGTYGMDSIIKNGIRHSVIDVTGIHGQHKHVEIYWMPVNQRSKNLTESEADIPDDYDTDRLYALINNNRDTVMIQHLVFKSIFRKVAEFYPNISIPAH